MIQILLATSLFAQTPDTSRITPPVSRITPAPATMRALPFGDDKVQHFFVTYAAYSFAYAGARAAGSDPKPSLVEAAVAAATIAVGKEVWDKRHRKPFSGHDLIADALGGMAAYALLRQVR